MNCGKKFTPTSGSTGKYCSLNCVYSYRRGRPWMFKQNHTSWNTGTGKVTYCLECGEPFIRKDCANRPGIKKASGRKYCSKECQIRSQKWKINIGLGNLGKKRTLEQINKMRLAHVGRTNIQVKNMLSNKKPNKTELLLNKILKINFPGEWRFVGNGKVVIDRKNPDFININGKNLLIELFGSGWHKVAEVNSRCQFFLKHGYRTLVIWDYELRRKTQENNIIKTIKNFMEDNNYVGGIDF